MKEIFPTAADDTCELIPMSEQRIEQTIERFAHHFKTHKKGLFILGPSGTGKTHYVRNQPSLDWIDGDTLWDAAGAHPVGPWWLGSLELIEAVDARSDEVTVRAKQKGLWIIGASNNWLPPDAIVIPDWELHQERIRYRETHNYDGGATSDRFDQVLSHREWILRWQEKGVPLYQSIEDAVDALTKDL